MLYYVASIKHEINRLRTAYLTSIKKKPVRGNQHSPGEMAWGAGRCPELFAAFSRARGVDADKIGKWSKYQQRLIRWGCDTKISGSLRVEGGDQNLLGYTQLGVWKGKSPRTGTATQTGSCNGHRAECGLTERGLAERQKSMSPNRLHVADFSCCDEDTSSGIKCSLLASGDQESMEMPKTDRKNATWTIQTTPSLSHTAPCCRWGRLERIFKP